MTKNQVVVTQRTSWAVLKIASASELQLHMAVGSKQDATACAELLAARSGKSYVVVPLRAAESVDDMLAAAFRKAIALINKGKVIKGKAKRPASGKRKSAPKVGRMSQREIDEELEAYNLATEKALRK